VLLASPYKSSIDEKMGERRLVKKKILKKGELLSFT
jgi:hypothetical protein